ncbi:MULTISPECIES: GNAT family N-acetyltransferase [Bacillus]|uniref:GNAT family N-acetyltransferase n=1 Tax=Bacillus TaxID=1386 RepID=UPI0013D33E48|nr:MULTISPECIES: GNAT family N-acetyltransferase [Bacillus cereus group]MDA1532612.1 GNAT family N-acetyltransferase [Bacillus cereus group sp. TH254-2LC]MDA1544503.1 GNAT family N-acetyltransferase [Bacillus cereus group sp. TH253LC]MDA1581946.1 GNAT family N-acetyltransferase [Bacillus cereus group sp. TH228LC]MDA1629206.1 GNAT family N-acetyltransferase [Bacillus cereus group sp. TH172LC]MDA1830004.1 GNAT family N-acetyltransferase [Bacillus cereus group sp. BY142LC]
MIQLHVYEEIVNFKEEVTLFLEKNEQENNLILGVLQMVHQPIFMGIAKQGEEIAVVFLQTEEKKQIIVATSEMAEEDIVELAKKLAKVYPNVPGLIGNKKIVQRLAEEIAVLENKKTTVAMEQGIYELKQVKKKWNGDEVFREVNSDELTLIEQWIYQFCEDVNLPTTKEEAKQTAHTLITNHRLFGLEVDGKLVSVAAKTRPTKNNITVNFVYTPKEERKKGYASNCVAALSQRMLDEGYKTTTLYTDLANPTSNKIYQEIGYEQIAESVLIFLEK